MNSKSDSEMLALLIAQADEQGGDLVMIRALVEEASDLGAARALGRLNLGDDAAKDDVRELRALLTGWRDAKKSARNAAIGWLVRVAALLLLLGLAVKLDLVGLIA
jgi:hypothetical protein